jgi:creatinine amidohydrolase
MTTRPTSPVSAQLSEATWTEVDDASATPIVVIIPIGSCEQHGPHLPLDTDTRIASAIAAGVAAAVPSVRVAPAIAISASGEHQGFAGTLSIGSAALELLLIELVRSADWSAGVVFVNGHGGNLEPVNNAVSTLRAEGRRVLSWWPTMVSADAHAGHTETSLMLTIAAQAVRTDVLEPGRTENIRELLPALRAEGVRAVSPNGVLGDPRGATAEAGAQILNTFVADAVAQIHAWRRA